MIKKLQSKRGATFIIALIYFLICMMAGAAMITAAAADRGRLAATNEEQNTYFAVSSAALSFRDKLTQAKFADYYEEYISGDKAAYEAAVRRGDPEYFDKDEQDNPIMPLPNERFRAPDGTEKISEPHLSEPNDPGKKDEFEPIYDTIARYARDIFYKELRASTSEYGAYTPYTGYEFKGKMELKDSNQPIDVSFKMVSSDNEYRDLNKYDIIMEFTNITNPDNIDEKQFRVSLVLKAAKKDATGVDGAVDSKIVTYKVDRVVTTDQGTETQKVPETVEIQKTSLDLSWDSAEIIIGKYE